MASLIDLRRRIRSVKNIQQITRAMKMVAAARLRRSQDRILAARPYAEKLRVVVSNLSSLGEGGHPLLEQREEKKILLAVVTGDKGLCGSFNTNIIRQARQELSERDEVELLLLGRRGAEFFKNWPQPIRAAHTSLFTNVTLEVAEEIAKDISEAYTQHEYDAVYIIYNQFISVMTQKQTLERLLPLEAESAGGESAESRDYIFEPSRSEILGEVVPGYVTTQVHRILLDSQAAEHAARMTAMDGATKNAGELIDRLTLTYNRSRQAAITTELIEVVSGAQALEG